MSWRFTPESTGVAVGLADKEWKTLAAVLDQFRELLMIGADPNLMRLQPPARLDDAEAAQEYKAMTGDQLLRGRLEAIELIEAGGARTTLDDDAVAAWMQTLNGIRLYLGERLGLDANYRPVDKDHPEAPVLALYEWIGWLLEQLIEAASHTLSS